jgi:hypothetical protein
MFTKHSKIEIDDTPGEIVKVRSKLLDELFSNLSIDEDTDEELSDEESSDSEYDSDSLFREEDSSYGNIIEDDEDQQQLVREIVSIISPEFPKSRNVTGNFSPTGSGKTVVAFLTAKAMDMNIVVYCPASAATIWINHAMAMDCVDRLVLISSLDLASNAREYSLRYSEGKCTIGKPVNSEHYISKKSAASNKKFYDWNDKACRRIYNNSLIVIDESHKITTASSRASFVLHLFEYLNEKYKDSSRFKRWNCRMLLQTATIAEKLDRYKRIFYMLNIIPDELPGTFKRFTNKILHEAVQSGISDADPVVSLRRYLKSGQIPYVVGCKTPKYPFRNTIKAELFEMDEDTTLKIERMNQEIAEIVRSSKKRSKGGFGSIQNKRREIEALMIPLYVTLCRALVEKGYAVAIFMSFLKTIDELEYQLRKYKPVVITGIINDKSIRDSYQRDFREGRTKVMILSVGVGSTCISLHDVVPKETKDANPGICKAHASILSLTYSMIDFLQMLGRLYRKGVRSDVFQILPLVKRTSHEDIAYNIISKLSVIEKFNDDVPRSESFYDLIRAGQGSKIEFDDISEKDTAHVENHHFSGIHPEDRPIGTRKIYDMIPDITEETLTEKDPEVIIRRIVPGGFIATSGEYKSIGPMSRYANRLERYYPPLTTVRSEKPAEPLVSLKAIQISANEYHLTGNTYPYKSLIKPISHQWNPTEKAWKLDSKGLKELQLQLATDRQVVLTVTTPKKPIKKPLPEEMTTTLVRLRKRADGTIVQDYDIYIGGRLQRGPWDLEASKWQNPYRVDKDAFTLEESLVLYEQHIYESNLIAEIEELNGKRLGCFCDPIEDKKIYCHGQVLIKLLESSRQSATRELH